MKSRIDLHVHTNVSDGKYSPREVVDMAIKNGVKVLGIADHDTIDAYCDDLIEYAFNKGIILVPAVEISVKFKGCGIHILGYNFDLNDAFFKKTLSSFRNNRHDYLYKVCDKLSGIGYRVNVLELDKIQAVTKAHIAIDVISNKDNESLLIDSFGHIPSKGEFIESVMNEGCRAYVKKETVSPKEAVELIRSAGGRAVLAHPVCYSYEDNLSVDDILLLVRELGIDAIEGNYIYVDRNNKRIDDSNYWNSFARRNNLLSTIGSDFHDFDDIRPEIGLINEEFDLDISSVLSYLGVDTLF